MHLADALGAPVFGSSWPAHIPFPTAHPLWMGNLPSPGAQLTRRLVTTSKHRLQDDSAVTPGHLSAADCQDIRNRREEGPTPFEISKSLHLFSDEAIVRSSVPSSPLSSQIIIPPSAFRRAYCTLAKELFIIIRQPSARRSVINPRNLSVALPNSTIHVSSLYRKIAK